jgi:hypothetical protein
MKKIHFLISLFLLVFVLNLNYLYSESHIISQTNYASKSKITLEEIEYSLEIGKGNSIGFFNDNHTFLLNLDDCKSFTTNDICFTKKISNTSIELTIYNTKPNLITSAPINKSNILIGATRTIKIDIINDGYDTAQNVKFTHKLPNNINILSKERNMYIKNNQIFWHGNIENDKKKELWYEFICNQSNTTKITGNVTYNNKETDRIIHIDEYPINCEIPFIINTSVNINKTKIGDNFTYNIFIKNNNVDNEVRRNISIRQIVFEDISCCTQKSSSNQNRIIYSKKIKPNETLNIPIDLIAINSDNKNIKLSIEYILYNKEDEQINKKPYIFSLSNFINISKIPLNCYVDILPKKISSLSNYSVIANCNIPYTTNRYTTPRINITSSLFPNIDSYLINFDKTLIKNYTTPFTEKNIEEKIYFNISYTDKFLNNYNESKQIKINITKYIYPSIKKTITYKKINNTTIAYLNISLINTANHKLDNITINEKNRYYNNLSKIINNISINETKEIFLIKLNPFLNNDTKNLTYLDSLTTLSYNLKNKNITNKQPRIIDLKNIKEKIFPKSEKIIEEPKKNITLNKTDSIENKESIKESTGFIFLSFVFIIFIIFIVLITFIFKKAHPIKIIKDKPKMPTENLKKDNPEKPLKKELVKTDKQKKQIILTLIHSLLEKLRLFTKKSNSKPITQIKDINHYLEFSKSRLEVYNLEDKEIDISSKDETKEEKIKIKNIIQEIEEKISLVLNNIDSNPELIELAYTLEKEYIKAKKTYNLYDNNHDIIKENTDTKNIK